MERLSPEQESLMTWLESQPSPVCLQEMEAKDAPGYTRDRVESMTKDGLLCRQFDSYRGELVGSYSVSDKGRAMLLQFENVRRQEAENKRFQTRQEKIAIAAIFASFLIFALGLIIEFNPGLVSGLAEFLGRWIK